MTPRAGTPRRTRLRRPSGFTLTEVAVSLGIASVLIVSIGSAMLVASKAVPDGHSQETAIVEAGRALEQIASELQYAIAFTERTYNSIGFTVPDRSGDGNPDLIRYSWSGQPGDPLMRQYNGGEESVFLDAVHHAGIKFRLKAVAQQGQTEQESAERLLISHDDSGGTVAHRAVESSKWPGQYFRPALPPEAVGWRVTRVKFKAKEAGFTGGITVVELRTADGSSKPTHKVIGSDLMFESGLSDTYLWQEFTFPSAPVLEPNMGACVVLRHGLGDQACWVRYESGGQDTPDAHYVRSIDRDASWSIDTTMDMLFYVYGTVVTTDAPADSTRYYLTGVDMALQCDANEATRVRTGVRVLGRPEVTGP